jgi:hypothetical protein
VTLKRWWCGGVWHPFVFFLRELIDKGITDSLQDVGVLVAVTTELEDTLNNGDLGGSGGQTAERCPVVDNEAATDGWITTVDGACNNRDLQEAANFVHILSGRLGVHEATVVCAHRVATNEGILGNRGTEGLHLQNIANDLLRFFAQVGMDQCHVIVADYAVAEGTKTLLYTLDFNAVGKGIPEMLQLLIGGDRGHDEAMTVTDHQAANHTGSADGGVDDGDVIGELLLEHGVEVLGCTSCDEAVGIRELGEDANVVTALKAGAKSHMFFKE